MGEGAQNTATPQKEKKCPITAREVEEILSSQNYFELHNMNVYMYT